MAASERRICNASEVASCDSVSLRHVIGDLGHNRGEVVFSWTAHPSCRNTRLSNTIRLRRHIYGSPRVWAGEVGELDRILV